MIQVRPSTLVSDIGQLFESSELLPFDLVFTAQKKRTSGNQSGISVSKRGGLGKQRSMSNSKLRVLIHKDLDGENVNANVAEEVSSEETLDPASPLESEDGKSRVFCHKTIVALRCPGLLKKHKKDTRFAPFFFFLSIQFSILKLTAESLFNKMERRVENGRSDGSRLG